MKINVLHPNEELNYNLTIKAALRNNQELIVIANNDDHHNQLEAFGLLYKEDQIYFYGIKYESDRLYQRIVKSKVGAKFQLRSNIQTGFWMPEDFTKVDLEPILNFLTITSLPYRTASKDPGGFTICDGGKVIIDLGWGPSEVGTHQKLTNYLIP